jgi:outer membrane receptor for ferric coprogen and ferric-rhodotorulic acid
VYGISEFDLSEATLLTLGFSYQNTEADAPLRSGFPLFYSNGAKTDFKRSFNTSPDWTYYDREQTSLFASVEHQFDNGWSGKVEVSHARNDYDAVVSYLASDTSVDQATGGGAYVMPTRFTSAPEQNGVDAYFTGPFSLFDREHELIVGLTASRTEEDDNPDWGGWLRPGGDYDGTIPDIHGWNGAVNKPQWTKVGENRLEEDQKALYLTSRFHLTDAATLILGGRVVDWDRTGTYTPEGGSSSKTRQVESGVTIPYAGLVYDLDETWALYTSYTKIFNPQGSWVRDVNNAPLAPEEGTSYEAGIKGAFYEGRLNASLALFKAEQDNLAVWDGNTFAYYLEEGVSSKGVELEVNGELAPGWQFSGGYTYNVSEDTEGSRIITQTPRHSAKAFTTYRLHGALDKLTLGGGLSWQSKTSYDLHTYTQDPYTLVNLMARYDISENLSASVNLNNLFDEKYFTSTSTYGTYGAPRNLMTGLKYSF